MSLPLTDLPLGLFRDIVDHTVLGVTIVDRDGRIVYANPARLATTGYTLDELVGQSPRIFGSGKTPPEIFDSMWGDILAGRVWYGEVLNRRKNGEMLREVLRVAPVRNDAGEITHFFAFAEHNRIAVVHSELAGSVAMVDPLTGLPNRAMLIDRAANRCLVPSGAGVSFSVVLLDIDKFRMVNESLGPVAADELLRRIANRLQLGVRESDMLARVGANQFALLIDGRSDSDVDLLARRLLENLATPVELPGGSMHLSGSIGIARFPLDARWADDLLLRAEMALASVKSEGGDGFRFYEPPSSDLVKEWNYLGAALRDVTRRDELLLHYQPEIDLRSGRVVALEALVRWRHPDHGLLAPGSFIGVAEETGLIVGLSEWVIRNVLAQLCAWRDSGRRCVPVGINLSLHHFHSGDLPGIIARELAASGISPDLLQIEISEGVLMRDPSHAFATLDRIKELGVGLILDDFGTGLSSLSYLSRMNVDKIKIDRSFVGDITTNPVNASIVAAIVAMGHKLGKRMMAVGVESEGQLKQLLRHECDEAQGFWFSKPVPADEVVKLMEGPVDIAANGPSRSQRSLLLVDDEPNILSALKRVLRREGYQILTAEGGDEALEILARNEIQVIISDHRMPGMTGIELLSKVRELYPSTRRIILSGYADISTLTDAINRGAIWKFIAKPWDDDDLREEIRHAFELTA